MASLRLVKHTWYVRTKQHGKEKMIRVGPDREQAETLKRKIEEELAEKCKQTLCCAWCEREVILTLTQKQAAARGWNIYCSKECQAAMENAGQGLRHRCGPCPTCGAMFAARTKGKKYCSLKCYTSSPELAVRLREHNEARTALSLERENKMRREAGIEQPARQCANCQQPCARARKFCSKDCMRSYYAARFDRWIADPQRIALPQNYDEFLMQEELPCIVEGCDWTGHHLSYHCNVTHGIPADKLKELAGFNRRTGLVSPETRRKMADRNYDLMAKGLIHRGGPNGFQPGHPQQVYPMRQEAAEHAHKARAELVETGSNRPDVPCRWCKKPTPQPALGRALYCSHYCRSQYYSRKGKGELSCSHCGKKFLANMAQIIRVQKGLKVCCSLECRNRMNIVAALVSRRTHETSQ